MRKKNRPRNQQGQRGILHPIAATSTANTAAVRPPAVCPAQIAHKARARTPAGPWRQTRSSACGQNRPARTRKHHQQRDPRRSFAKVPPGKKVHARRNEQGDRTKHEFDAADVPSRLTEADDVEQLQDTRRPTRALATNGHRRSIPSRLRRCRRLDGEPVRGTA